MGNVNLIIGFIIHLACLLFILRFLLQASQADFYNPLSQAIVKGSDPLCRPLRKILPGFRNLDFASLVTAWLIATLGVFLIIYINTETVAPIGAVIWQGLIETLRFMLQFYWFAILIVVIASFLVQGSYHPALALLHQLIEPVVAPIRKILPNFGPLDLSPMLVFLIIMLLQNTLAQVAPRVL